MMLAIAENALVDRLKTHRDIGQKVRTVATLPKIFGEDLLKKYIADAPALYVVPGRFTVKDSQATMRFTVAGLVRNVAGHEKARKGDGIDIGCDHLATLAIRALHDQRVGDCTWFVTGGEMADEELFSKSGLSAIELTLESSAVELSADYGVEQLVQLDNFTRFHADIDIPPHAGDIEYASWLQEPPDHSTSTPDATLDVQLTGAS